MSLHSALSEWRNLLGSDYVVEDSGELQTRGKSTIPFLTNTPIAILKPKNTLEVSQVVKVANKFRISLYPISTGHNWGFGEACPTTSGQVLLDLGRMNKIWEANKNLSYVVIEPGVTQGQLYDYLKQNEIDLWLDITGAGPDTSVIGNLCERGYGHLPIADKFLNSCNYEVVLPNGEIICTGFGHYKNAECANVFKTGIGPSIDGLFTQSNLGILTKATFWLMPKPESFAAVAFTLKDGFELWSALEVVQNLIAQGSIRSFIHFGNDLRLLSARTNFPYDLCPNGILTADKLSLLRNKFKVSSWSAMTAFYGSKSTVKASINDFKNSMKKFGRVVAITDTKISLANWIFNKLPVFQKLPIYKEFKQALPVFRLLKGIPDPGHLKATRWRNRNIQDHDGKCHLEESGLIWHSPIIPFEEVNVQKAIQIAQRTITKYGLEPMISLILLNSRCICMPTSISFDKASDSETENAREAYAELVNELKGAGFYSYRSGVQGMINLDLDKDSYWNFVRNIKEAIDPQGTIAPGRYDPGSNQSS